ncbi:hypothetical protein DFJ67_0757 [Asanoa ferruginea]|uniref:Uncharacterized protein n=1 Tax=Asanoa ferruginea TaxID=53367 RepID=A0A3D9ZG24_9ACTN|nr:hypothetical protein [Asanoa ferruginea]REF94813.1 hypothetical protein DFJ67_0757 [Asanoa ferruginea]GIF45609.1 hypothetical protein Afe04nite_01480 [Asanoa ferruginea]
MEDKDTLNGYLELWKQSVEVQKHFNDIELRIRSLALTVVTFALGGATLAIKDDRSSVLFGVEIHLASAILFAGFVVWVAFYFVDQVWYHRLLVGAVLHAEALERIIDQYLPGAGLTASISKNSAYSFKVRVGRTSKVFTIRSRQKIQIFYTTVSAVLLLLALVIQLGTK